MPGFPDDVLQKNTVGSAGEQALREAFTFISYDKKHARFVDFADDRSTCLSRSS